LVRRPHCRRARLEFDLRLEGLSVVKDKMFTGQHLRLSGVAFLWYRLFEPNGTLLLADTVRKITVPVEVNLRPDVTPKVR
jgi:hypothetical protein